MTLRLILGPANASKTGRLLDAHQRASRAGRDAWFVVPTSTDVERVQRELAGADVVPGRPPRQATPFSEVMTGSALERRLAGCLGVRGRPLGREPRRAVMLAATRAVALDALAPARRAGWLADDLIGLREELLATGTPIADAASGARRWGAAFDDRRGAELAALLTADDALLRELAAAGWHDRAAIVDGICAALARGSSPGERLHVVLSGFDDLDPLQRKLVSALGRSDADVELSLPWEEDRVALAAAEGLVRDLQAAGGITEPAAAPADDATPTALARVERMLFAPPVDGAPAAEAAADDETVMELRGGGPDEELALIAETLAEELAAGRNPERMAVVVAAPAKQGPAIVAALRRRGVPGHLAAAPQARQHPSVAALHALLRAAGPDGKARDVVDWIAGPGGPGRADALDAKARRSGARSATDALKLWRRIGGSRVEALDELRAAREPGALERATAKALRLRLEAVLAEGRPLRADELRDLRAGAALLTTLDGLAAFAEGAAQVGVDVRLGVPELASLLQELPAPAEPEPPGSVAVLGPLEVRTRHVEVVVLARAQRGSYPQTESLKRTLAPADRGQLRDFGWPQRLRAEHLAAERYLAYEIAARPTERLLVAWHAGNGDGKPAEASPLLAELRRAAGGQLPLRALAVGSAGRRALREERLARLRAARAGERHREPSHERSALLAAQEYAQGHGVRALQSAARCPAQWLAERHLGPQPLRPDEDPLTAGVMRHDLLSTIVRQVVLEAGITLGPQAEPALRDALAGAAERQAEQAARVGETLPERLLRERVVAEVAATLPALCGSETLAHQPQEFELGFGGRAGADPEDEERGDARPPVAIRRGRHELLLSGRIDRVDIDEASGEVVVVDYKGTNVDPYKASSWVKERELQAGLYALVAQQLAGPSHRAVASLYQPVPGGPGSVARGASIEPLGGRGVHKRDTVGAGEWDELLDALVALAAEAQDAIDDGVCRPDPDHCSAGGCRHPWLCREVER